MAKAKFNDNDQLNMSGDWDIFYRDNLDPTFLFPPKHTQPPLRVRLKAVEKTDGGQKFQGKVITPNDNAIEYQGETFYLKQGRQVLQMIAVFKPLQWVQAHAGQHQPNPTNDGNDVIIGAAMDRGGPLGVAPDSPAGVSFKMVKVRPK